MCLSCHIGLSDDHIYNDLNNVYKLRDKTDEYNKKMEQFNSTSISHFILASTGYNGVNVADLASKLLKDYVIFKKYNVEDYTNINKVLKYVKENPYNGSKDIDEFKKYLSTIS